MTALFPIPDSWVWTTLGEIADVVGGVTKDSKKQSDPHLPQVPYLRVANVQRGYLELSEIAQIRVPESTATKLRLRPGDVLLNEGGDRDKLGRGWIWQGQISDCIHQNHVFRARLAEGMHPKLLAWYANEIARDWFSENASQSVNLASISLSTMKRLPVPLPPAGEQRRIVAIVEGHLSTIAHGSSALNKAVLRAALLKRSVMDVVASGRILCKATQRNPHEELAPGWRWAAPEELTSGHRSDIAIGPFGSDLKVTDYTDSGVPLIFVRDIRLGRFGVKNPRFVSIQKANALRAHKARKGDILITKMGDPPGDACVYASDEDGIITADCIRLRPGQSWNPEYLAIAINSSLVRRQIKHITRGVAQQKVSLARFRQEIRIPVPPIELQDAALEEGGRYISAIGSLEAILAIADQRRAALHRSLLAEAFAGRLVEQDPADEPASMLLERIRAGQAALGSARRSRRELREMSPQEEALF